MTEVNLQMVWRSSQLYEESELLKLAAAVNDRLFLRTD
jgi:hypothetical protein